MIKIGRSYFNESQIAAIQPSAAGDYADVYLVRGAVITEKIWEDDLQALLEEAGLLVSVPAADPLIISPVENAELWSAYEDGYLFAAKDKSGQVYAYRDEPEKGTGEWIYTGYEEAGTRRLHGKFDFLSFEDEKPLDLADLFGRDTKKDADDV